LKVACLEFIPLIKKFLQLSLTVAFT
jgi:hypothetical protein